MPASPGRRGGVEEITPADWRRCIDVCLTGQFLCAHLAVPMIRKAGGGAIVNMSSAAGRFGYAFRTPYSSAKWGVIGFTQSLAKEVGPDNIRVNAILPGIVEGPRMEGVIRARAGQLGVSYEEMESALSGEGVAAPHGEPSRMSPIPCSFCCRRAGQNISGQSLGVAAMSRRCGDEQGCGYRSRIGRPRLGDQHSPAPAMRWRCSIRKQAPSTEPSASSIPFLTISRTMICLNGAQARNRARPTSRERDRSQAALAGAIHVQENAPEDIAVKRKLYAELDALGGAGYSLIEFDLGIVAVAPLRGACGREALPRRASDQPALSHPRRRSGAFALDGTGDRRRAPRNSCARPARRRS